MDEVKRASIYNTNEDKIESMRNFIILMIIDHIICCIQEGHLCIALL